MWLQTIYPKTLNIYIYLLVKKWIPLMDSHFFANINQLGSQPLLGAGWNPAWVGIQPRELQYSTLEPARTKVEPMVGGNHQLVILPVKFRLLLLKSSVVCCFYSNLAILLILFTVL
jgi:hypothetical protein